MYIIIYRYMKLKRTDGPINNIEYLLVLLRMTLFLETFSTGCPQKKCF